MSAAVWMTFCCKSARTGTLCGSITAALEPLLVLRGVVWYDTGQEAVAVWHNKHSPMTCAHR